MMSPEDCAQHIEGKELLILGGTGFFGQALLSELVPAVDARRVRTRIVVTTRSAARATALAPVYAHPCIQLVEVDFEHQSRVQVALRPDYILHMATTSARETFSGKGQLRKFELLVNATRAVCDVLTNGAAPARVVFTSSGVVYGPEMPHGGFRETDPVRINPLDPASSLAMGKVASEYLLSAHCAELGIPLSIARCFSFVGPHLPTDIHYAIGNFVSDALAGRDIVIRGDGQDIRSYMHVRDAVRWICHLLFSSDAPPVVNVGSPEPLSIEELARRVADLINPAARVRILGEGPTTDNFRRRSYWPDVTLARSLGLSLSMDLSRSVTELGAVLGRAQRTVAE